MQLTTFENQKKTQDKRSPFHVMLSMVLKNRKLSQRGLFPAANKILSLAVAIALSCQALTLQAQVRDWVNTTNSNPWFEVGTNWSPVGAPGSSGTARFQQSGTYPGNFSDFEIRGEGALTIRGLHLRSLGGAQLYNGGTLTLDGSHSAGTRMSVEGSTGFRVLGNSVNVLAGGVLNSTQTILHGGAATVSGNGSQWNTTSALRVGESTSVGVPFNFTLNVASGGLVTSGTGFIGKQGNGTVNVNGVGSRWNNVGTLWVGENDGNAALNIQAGVQVTSGGNGAIAVGSTSNGTVVVTGAGSKWTNDGFTYVGFGGIGGSGTLNVQAGGEVVNIDGSVGVNTGGTGTVTVTGADSKWKFPHAIWRRQQHQPRHHQLDRWYGEHGRQSDQFRQRTDLKLRWSDRDARSIKQRRFHHGAR